MLFYARAGRLWKNLPLDLKIAEAYSMDHVGHAVLEYLLCTEQSKTSTLGQLVTAETYATTCWFLWWDRRKIVNGKTIQTEMRSAMAIDSLISNYRTANIPKAKHKRVSWSKPPPDYIKVSTLFDEDSLRGTTGVDVLLSATA
jgi:hypothetical protein